MKTTSHCHFTILFKHLNNSYLMNVRMEIIKGEKGKVPSVGPLHPSLLSDSILLAVYLEAPELFSSLYKHQFLAQQCFVLKLDCDSQNMALPFEPSPTQTCTFLSGSPGC